MSDTEVPEVRFDSSIARRIFPRPELKLAALVPMPPLTEGGDVPTFIRPEWGGLQVFYGSYYAIIKDGKVIYGSAKEQWEAMHTQMEPGKWVKTAIPTAYQATEVCKIVTLIPTEDGSVREASFELKPGDWIVRQPGGEVQHIKAEKFESIYYSIEEATESGLDDMTPEQFTAMVMALVPLGVS